MGMDVDESGRDQQATGVDLLAARAQALAEGGDLAVADRDVALDQIAAGAVGDGPAAHDQVEVSSHERSPWFRPPAPARGVSRS
jgi:hypothetical protein